MIDKNYRKCYEAIFKEILTKSPPGFYDETALPSYTHSNKLMSWLFWKRIDTVFSIAGDLYNKSVLDFGCGGGITFKYLDKCGCKITGCDNKSYKLASEICDRLGINADIYKDLFEIGNQKFDYILALDVLEHVEDLDLVVDKFSELSHDRTEIIISGPTENMLYKIGRLLAGFSGHYHVRNIYDIENKLKERGLKNKVTKNLFFPFVFFRVSSWSK